ncbi:hypothetical protein BHE97_04600 [Aeromicrobium sp. PE09-221]|uniref:LuxR C-terminal-related transcriptional regulator n=1 Tax=Aeromicrobium sp. PE09-221 TaxID=1898043 RepID=UPI000B3EA5D6|nr:LuxR C-terminal-related transcriptional regulator [Aeromicrobium sp. PE09-221]OUZ11618.1 hypothetical protein BHE97_04600 [Aeromicrobium sp. PE09-221]
MWRHDLQCLERAERARVLSGPAPVVAIVGPEGAGKTTLLAAWAHDRTEARWFDPGQVDPPAGTVLLADEADNLSAEDWKLLMAAAASVPRVRIRVAARSVSVLPDEWSAEIMSPYFDKNEVALCLQALASAADPRTVFALTGGHPASVIEMARSGATAPRQLAAALSSGTTAQLPAALADLAFPDHLSKQVVIALGHDVDVIDEMERAGWGGWIRGTRPMLFSLTPRHRASTKRGAPIPAARRRELHRRAAETLLAEGANFPALVEALHADRLDLADAALKRAGLPLLTAHGYELLLLLEPIPALRLRHHPALAMALALAYNARERTRLKAIEMVGIALAGARLGSRSPADRALMRTVESVGLRITGTADGGLRAARAAARMLAELPVEDREGLGSLEPDLHTHIAISLLYGGAADEAATEFEHAWSVHARAGVQLQVIGGRAIISALDGRMTDAGTRTAEAGSRSWPPEFIDGYAGSLLRIAQAIEAVERFDFVSARERIHAVWPHAETIEHWSLLIHVRALVDIGTGDAEAGLERFREMRARRSARRGATAATQRRLDVTDNLLALATGDLMAASSLRPTARDRSDVVLAAARVALLTGDYERAARLVARCEVHTPIDRLTRATLEMMLARRLGREDAALAAGRRARALVDSFGVRSPLLFVPRQDRDLLGASGLSDVPVVLQRDRVSPLPLTAREKVVLRELIATPSAHTIAAQLQVSVNTVKSQRRSLYRKLGATSREEAVAAAIAHGVLDA